MKPTSDMQHLVRHLFNQHRAEIVKKSCLNCHAVGLHSIMLCDTPEQRIRLFVTDEKHELWKNHPLVIRHGEMSVGFHAHHCDLTLHCVMGTVCDRVVSEESGGQRLHDLKRFEYRSKLRGEVPGFILDGTNESLQNVDFRQISVGSPVAHEAKVMHSVYVPGGERAAWFVYEGKEDPNYKPVTYSNAMLTELDFSQLYLPITEEEVTRLLDNVFQFSST